MSTAAEAIPPTPETLEPHLAVVPSPEQTVNEAESLNPGLPGVKLEAVLETPQTLTEQAPVPKAPRAKTKRPAYHGKDPDDLVRTYLDQIGREPLLTKEDEIELAQARDRGREAKIALETAKIGQKRLQLRRDIADGEAAKQRFIRANTRLVVSIAKRYQASGVPLLDLIQEGNIGLMRAVEKFDWRKGFKFSTYATWWIKQGITRNIPENSRTIRLPSHAVDKAEHLYDLRVDFVLREGREPTATDLAEITGWKKKVVLELMRADQPIVHLEHKTGDGKDAEVGDFVADTRSLGEVEDAVEHAHNLALMKELLTILDERELRIIAHRFALFGYRHLTLEEVGEEVDLTRERVRQIEAGALKKMREHAAFYNISYN